MNNAKRVLIDPATSDWLRHALRTALACDPVTVANEAELLLRLLHERVETYGQADDPSAAASPPFPRAWIPGVDAAGELKR